MPPKKKPAKTGKEGKEEEEIDEEEEQRLIDRRRNPRATSLVPPITDSIRERPLTIGSSTPKPPSNTGVGFLTGDPNNPQVRRIIPITKEGEVIPNFLVSKQQSERMRAKASELTKAVLDKQSQDLAFRTYRGPEKIKKDVEKHSDLLHDHYIEYARGFVKGKKTTQGYFNDSEKRAMTNKGWLAFYRDFHEDPGKDPDVSEYPYPDDEQKRRDKLKAASLKRKAEREAIPDEEEDSSKPAKPAHFPTAPRPKAKVSAFQLWKARKLLQTLQASETREFQENLASLHNADQAEKFNPAERLGRTPLIEPGDHTKYEGRPFKSAAYLLTPRAPTVGEAPIRNFPEVRSRTHNDDFQLATGRRGGNPPLSDKEKMYLQHYQKLDTLRWGSKAKKDGTYQPGTEDDDKIVTQPPLHRANRDHSAKRKKMDPSESYEDPDWTTNNEYKVEHLPWWKRKGI